MKVCIICGTQGENHHVKTRGSSGTDDYYNLMPLCREHHQNIHFIGLTTFASKYSEAREWLIRHAWEYSAVKKKWIRY